jgi:hypothetical protein
MWLEKLAEGVLRVQTPLGPRFVKPVFAERVYLLWLFRNFSALPANVLSRKQQRRIEGMCQRRGFVSHLGVGQREGFAVLGTLEQRPPADETSPARGMTAGIGGAVSSFAVDAQRQS